MGFLESLFYGFISGIAEFMPVSLSGHQQMFKYLMDVKDPTPVLDLLVHIAILLAILITCRTYFGKLRRDLRSESSAGRRFLNRAAAYDNRLIKTAIYPLLFVSVVLSFLRSYISGFAMLALMFAINGIIIYIPEHFPHGNKDASKMSRLDGILIGFSGGLCVIPGFSGVGISLSCATVRGAEQSKALNWFFALSLPMMLVLILTDIVMIFTAGIGLLSFTMLFGYLLAAIVAFGASILGISFIRYLTARNGFSALGFYCWGVALLSFILYLTT